MVLLNRNQSFMFLFQETDWSLDTKQDWTWRQIFLLFLSFFSQENQRQVVLCVPDEDRLGKMGNNTQSDLTSNAEKKTSWRQIFTLTYLFSLWSLLLIWKKRWRRKTRKKRKRRESERLETLLVCISVGMRDVASLFPSDFTDQWYSCFKTYNKVR